VEEIEGDIFLASALSSNALDRFEDCGAKLNFSGDSMCVDLGDDREWQYLNSGVAVEALKQQLDSGVSRVGFCFQVRELDGRIINCTLFDNRRWHYWTSRMGPFENTPNESQRVRMWLERLLKCCGVAVAARI